jgi:hypothetical protein
VPNPFILVDEEQRRRRLASLALLEEAYAELDSRWLVLRIGEARSYSAILEAAWHSYRAGDLDEVDRLSRSVLQLLQEAPRGTA